MHNQKKALVDALVLAVLAPTEEQSKKAVNLAKTFANGLSAADVEICQAIAKKMCD